MFSHWALGWISFMMIIVWYMYFVLSHMCLVFILEICVLIFMTSQSLYIYGYACENKLIYVLLVVRGVWYWFVYLWMNVICLFFMCYIGYYLYAFLLLHFVAWTKIIWLMSFFNFFFIMVFYVGISWYMFDLVVKRVS